MNKLMLIADGHFYAVVEKPSFTPLIVAIKRWILSILKIFNKESFEVSVLDRDGKFLGPEILGRALGRSRVESLGLATLRLHITV